MAERARFGELLRQYRREAGLTQEELAQRTRLSVDAIAGLERGRRTSPHVDTLRRLIEALDLAPARREEFLRAAEPGMPRPVPTLEVRSNLPVALSSFVGRTDAARALRQLLGGSEPRTRLLTLVGPGGIGKTRLALEVAGCLGDAAHELFPDGIWLADLSALEDPALVPGAVAAAIDLDGLGAGLSLDGLSWSLSGRRLLLVLDNCEHLVEPCARLADALLRAGPGLALLATSREALGVAGEVVWPVAPLSFGDSKSVLDSEAGRLFAERARAVQPDFQIRPDEAETVAALCRQLDGIPLAIELAAARVSALDLPTLARGVTDHFVVLRNTNRLAPPRHQTLQALVQWSYDLLSPDAQLMFARLAVFAGDWDIDAVVAIRDGRDSPTRVIDLLTHLVDRSLVARMQARDGTARYRMLETLRTFALQLLRDSEELPALRARYATHYLERLQAAEAWVEGAQQAETLDRLEQDIDNIRAALDWSLASDDAEPALRGAWCLAVLAWLRGYLQEVDARLTRLLDSASGRNAEPEVRAGAQVALGYVCFYRGQLERAHELVESGLQMFRQLRRSEDTARALVWYGLILDTHSQLQEAQACFIEALEVFRNKGDEFWTARAATNLGRSLARANDIAGAIPLLQEALALRRRLGDARGVANTLHHLSDAVESSGDLDQAEALAAEALALAASAGDRFVTVRALIGLGRLAYTRRRLDTAADYLQRALDVAERDDFGHEVAEIAALAGLVEYDRDCLERAAALGQQAVGAAREYGRHAESARALFVLGRVAQGRGQVAEASARFRESVAEYREVPDRSGMAMALAALASLLKQPAHRGCLDAATTVQHASGTAWSIERYELERLLSDSASTSEAPDDLDEAVEQALSG